VKYLEKQISDLLKEIEKLLENGEYQKIDNKRKELDKLLKEYIENFK
jgi:hypothetical protein